LLPGRDEAIVVDTPERPLRVVVRKGRRPVIQQNAGIEQVRLPEKNRTLLSRLVSSGSLSSFPVPSKA